MSKGADLAGRNVLIVDDDSDIRFLLRVLVTGELPGLTVLEAADGVEALEILSTTAIDVTVLDGMMPNLNGFDVIATMLAQGQPLLDVPVIGFDSLPEAHWRRRPLPPTFVYLSKPTSTTEIVAAIAGAIRADQTASAPTGLHVAAAMAALSRRGHQIEAAYESVPSKPGLYAMSADPEAWDTLGLDHAWRPLYIGKAEASLVGRDLKTHFATGKTGHSTLRRSLAGLLAEELDLHAQPRNPSAPGYFASFGLEPSGDQRLTDWIHQHLRIAVWPSPPGAILDVVETAVLSVVVPPLNLSKVRSRWRAQVDSGRRALAAEARAWRPPV